jgi:hypothetical protein
MRGKYLSVLGKCTESIKAYMENTANVGLFAVLKIVSECAESFNRIRRKRGKNLCVYGKHAKSLSAYFSYYAKRHKSVYISVNNNTNFKISQILSLYTIWDGLRQKTISRYCPFKSNSRPRTLFHVVVHSYDLYQLRNMS